MAELTPDDDTLSELIGDLYDGVLQDGRWESFLARCNAVFGAAASMLVIRPRSTDGLGLMFAAGGVAKNVAAYREGIHRLDSFVGLPSGAVVTLYEFVDRCDWLAGELYQRLMEPSDIADVMGVDFEVLGLFDVRLRICRSSAAGAFGCSDRDWCLYLLPHLRRAVHQCIALAQAESKRAAYVDIFDHMQRAVAIIDGGRILCANKRWHKAAKGVGLSVAGGGPRLGSWSLTQTLRERIDDAIRRQRRGPHPVVEVMRFGEAGGHGAHLIIQPLLFEHEACRGPLIQLSIFDPASEIAVSVCLVRQLFGFSHMQAEVAYQLVRGLPLKGVAQAMGISLTTVRTHLRYIYKKTGVKKQPELVSMILKSGAALG